MVVTESAQSHKYHACHAKRRWMSPSATLATSNDGGCHQVPRLPRKMARRPAAYRRDQARHQSQPSPISTTPATQNESPETAQSHKYHVCHAKQRWMSLSARPATQSDRGCHQVPRLPRKMARRPAASRPDQAHHQSQPSPISTTPATQNNGGCRQATPATPNDGGCHQVPRLPRKMARCPAASRPDQARHQSQPSPISTTPATQNNDGCRQVPRLPRETTADVTKCRACHAKWRGVPQRPARTKRVTRASPVP